MKIIVCRKQLMPNGKMALIDPELVDMKSYYLARDRTNSDISIMLEDDRETENLYVDWIRK